MSELQKITPYLWYDHSAREAVDLYVSLFPHSRVVSSGFLLDPGRTARLWSSSWTVSG